MNILFEKKDDAQLVIIDGRIDTSNYNDFEKHIDGLASNHKVVIVNCSKMNYISSSGLRVFLLLQKKIKASGGMLTLCGLQPAIKEIFDMSGFSSIFSIEENCQDQNQ